MRILAKEMEGKVKLPNLSNFHNRRNSLSIAEGEQKARIADAVGKIVRKYSAVSRTDISEALFMMGEKPHRLAKYCKPHEKNAQGNPFLLKLDSVRMMTLEEAVHRTYPAEIDVDEFFTLGNGRAGGISKKNKLLYLDEEQLERYVKSRINLTISRKYTLEIDKKEWSLFLYT